MFSNKIRYGLWSLVLGGFAMAVAMPPLPPSRQQRKTTDPPVASKGQFGQDLFLAIDHRDLAGVQALIRKGADPNSRNGLEMTPLYLAAASHQPEVMQALLDAGAQPDAPSAYGTPLTFAAITANSQGAAMLFAKNVKIDSPRGDGDTALMMAALAGDPDSSVSSSSERPMLTPRTSAILPRSPLLRGPATLPRARCSSKPEPP